MRNEFGEKKKTFLLPFRDGSDSKPDELMEIVRRLTAVEYSKVRRTERKRSECGELRRSTHDPRFVSKVVERFHRIDARHRAVLHSENDVRPIDVDVSNVLSNENEIRSKRSEMKTSIAEPMANVDFLLVPKNVSSIPININVN